MRARESGRLSVEGREAETLGTILRHRVEQTPDRLILRFVGDRDEQELRLTYAELDRRARAVAARLLDAGAAGKRALILHAPGAEYVIALYGCFYAGVVAVPAYPPRFNRPLPRLRSLIADCQAEFALTSRALIERSALARASDSELARLTWIASDEALAGECTLPHVAPDALALLQYTSGSTSDPKGVMLSHAHFLHNVHVLQRRSGASSSDRWVSWLPPYHDMGLIGGILLPLCTGIEVALFSPAVFVQRPRRWLEVIARVGGTISGGPNFAYELCARRIDPSAAAQLDLRSWRIAFSGAERVRADTLERFARALAPAGFRARAFVPCYGLAEATLGVTVGAIAAPLAVASLSDRALGEGKVQSAVESERSRTLVGSGRPLEDVAVAIVHPERRTPCAATEVGEIWVRSPSVALGYWNAPELSERTFRAQMDSVDPAHAGNYLRTGDLGFLRDGELFVSGRAKDLMIVGGRNHYPEDVEASAQAAHPALRDRTAVAFATESESEERLVLVQELDAARVGDAPELARALRRAIAQEHELPLADLVFVRAGSVPRTSSGKLQRALCRTWYLAGQLTRLAVADESDAAPPPSASTEQVAALMAELLELPSVAHDDDFFALGGHSLLATQLVSRVQERLGVELHLSQLFEASTPARLAALLATLPRSDAVQLEACDRSAPLPLSSSQERMWFLHQLEPSGSAYNVSGAVEITGPLDADALRESFSALSARHEVLRTRYDTLDGAPRVTIAEQAPLEVPLLDLSAHVDAEAQALRAACELASRPFDVAREAPARAALFQIGPDRHVLVASLHHLVADAWSMGLLLRELLLTYEARRSGRALPAAQLEFGYVDYAAHQRRQLARGALAHELDYWRERLRGAEPLLLPTARPRSQRRSSRGAIHKLELSSELREAVRELGHARGATPFMVLLAAFEVVLQRHSGQRDLVVGVPVANRNHVQAEQLVGTLVNTLALRTQVEPEQSFDALLCHVRERSLEAFDHQNLPFERLVSELNVERRAGESPLVQVMFDYQNVPMAFRTATLALKPCTISRGATQFDLSLLLHDSELGYTGALEYSTDLFDADAMQRFGEQLVNVLGAVVAQPDLRLADIPLVSAGERRRILAAAEGPAAEGEFSLLARFRAHVEAQPEAPAVYDARGALTYAELERRVTALALQLAAHGAGPGERVALHLRRGKELVVALLAVLRCRAAYVPLDPRHPAARVAYVLEDAAPRIIVTDGASRGSLPSVDGACVIDVERAMRELQHSDLAFTPATPESAAYLIYTSGSTGRPKGVEVSVGALDNFLAAMAREPGLSACDRVLATTTVTFDIAGLELLLPIACGASVFVAEGEVASDAQQLNELLRSFAPTVMQATPASFRLLIEAGFRGARELTILCGGEALSRELARALLERAGAVWNMYGPTETTVWSLVHRVRNEDEIVPIGRPIRETRVYVLDARGALCPIGVAGELCIGGAGVANGYHQRPELTRERFLRDPFASEGRLYRTGDLARLRADGSFEHLGRLDHQVKIRGFRIEPGEIESVLKESARVRDALVIAREDRRDDVRLVAYFVPQQADVSPAELREQLAKRLPEYMIPSAFVPLSALPHTPNGKIDRAALPAPSGEHAAQTAERIGPRDELERRLSKLFHDVLGAPPESVRDSFFALGGHSLLAVRLFARLQRELAVDLPLATLFEAPTVEQLAERIRALAVAPPPSAVVGAKHLVPIVAAGQGRPLFCVHGAGGNVVGLTALARHVAAERPFYALQARGVDGVAEPFATIEEAAETYLSELRTVQPHGPYHLAGYCGGGAIAFEMARQLVEQGERVALLALLDTFRPGSASPSPSRAAQLARNWQRHGTRFVAGRVHRRLAAILLSWYTVLSIALHRALSWPVPHAQRDPWLTYAFLRAAARYRPRPYPGRLVVVRAREGEGAGGIGPELGWSGLAAGGIEVHETPGTHHTLIDEPHVRELALTLRGCLERAERALAAPAVAPLPVAPEREPANLRQVGGVP